MNMKLVAIVIIAVIALSAVAVIGSNLLQGGSNKLGALEVGFNDSFTVDDEGGSFKLLEDNVEVNVYAGSVSEQIEITLEVISNPVDDSALYFLSAFEFGPDGLVFARPIELIVHYDVNDLPEGMDESQIKIYVLSGGVWEPIAGSFVNQAQHYAVAEVSHFTKMGACGPAPSSGGSTNTGGSEQDGDETQSQYWFKANLQFYSHKDVRLNDWDDDDMYGAGVSAFWDPAPYAQYYQIKFVFNGNPPKAYGWSCDFREQGKSYCPDGLPYMKEGYIFNLGGNPELEGFLGLLTSGEATATKYDPETGETTKIVIAHIFPEGKHGFNVIGVHSTVNDAEELSDFQIGTLVSEMESFIQNYVDGWEIWVRPVTQTEK